MRWWSRLPFFYGWVMVALIFVCFAVGYAAYHSFSIFYVAILTDYGWSRASTAAALSIFSLVYGFSSPLTGGFVDRFGPRLAMPVAAIVLGVGLLLMTRMSSILEFYLIYGVVVALALSSLGLVPSFAVLSGWFIRGRGLAWGIAVAGVGVGTFFFAPLLQRIIDTQGWRTAYGVLAAAVLIVIPALYLFFSRHRPEDLGLLPDGDRPDADAGSIAAGRIRAEELIVDREWASREWTLASAVRTRRFWQICAARFLEATCLNIFLTHQAAYMVDQGWDKLLAASVVGTVGIIGSFGKVLWGAVSDRLGREVTLLLPFASGTAGAVVMLLAGPGAPVWLLYLYAVLFGLFYGGYSVLYLCLTGDIFQSKRSGAIVGGTYVATGVGLAAGAFFGGYMFDLMGNYTWAFITAIPAMWLSVAIYWITAPRKVRLVAGKLERRRAWESTR
jgi:sugar phosphate permease